VAILARGRIVSLGKLADLTAPAMRGSEVVVSNLNPEAASRMAAHAARVTEIADGRYCFELGPGDRPEAMVAALAAAGATLVSVSPVRASLEDVFMEATQ
jgi:hypothetical protein